MIHYELCCSADHGFDGWFRDSATFDAQVRSGLVTCPVCASASVRRALMAPPVRTSRRKQRAEPVADATPASPQAPQVSGAVLPDQVRALLQRMRSEIEASCEHVGDRFAEEARAIHNGDSEARPIYGESTPEQAEALAEDGIEITRIPWIPRADG
jgi:hypothetical protein